jgi:hypothetical protein
VVRRTVGELKQLIKQLSHTIKHLSKEFKHALTSSSSSSSSSSSPVTSFVEIMSRNVQVQNQSDWLKFIQVITIYMGVCFCLLAWDFEPPYPIKNTVSR